jgi:hypothetical protein
LSFSSRFCFPAALAADTIEMRHLARTRCVACSVPIGLAEIRRAKEQAQAKAMSIASAIYTGGTIPGVIVGWEVTCPSCGQAYLVPQGAGRRALAAKASSQGGP